MVVVVVVRSILSVVVTSCVFVRPFVRSFVITVRICVAVLNTLPLIPLEFAVIMVAVCFVCDDSTTVLILHDR